MQLNASPDPFEPDEGYTITITGGTPPYQAHPKPSPPNPPGVEVSVNGNEVTVTFNDPVSPGTTVEVGVTDSSSPPQGATSTNTAA